jgi:sirohydrochlorin cobaltochelatase
MNPEHALILFAHGARDARWSEPLQALRAALATRLPGSAVEVAFLELQAPTLDQALQGLAASAVRRIDVVPVFWAIGGHVATDLPAMVDRFRAAHPRIEVDVLPVLSALPGMVEFIADAVGVLAKR